MLETQQKQLFMQSVGDPNTFRGPTIGIVVDTNDPQQMGRVRAICLSWGDTLTTPVEDIPWATYVTQFGGQVSVGTRGPGLQESKGGIAYGMWAIPKIGAQVIIQCLDNDPMQRIYTGCVYDQFTPHTLPHGRWMYDDHPELEKSGPNITPYGPYTSQEKFIEPLRSNMKQAFGNKSKPNYEWQTRAADYTVSALAVEDLDRTYSKVSDDRNVNSDGWSSTQGYQSSRIDPNAKTTLTTKNNDSQVYSITSPGFHSISMDDRQENARIRIRTTSGHQIIIDDTNERIYISTSKGNNWIEMDQDGDIDVFSATKISLHSAKELNLTSDDSIRMHAAKGIHMYSNEEIRMQSKQDIHVKTDQNLRIHSAQNTFIESNQNLHVKTNASIYMTAIQELNSKSGSDTKISSNTNTNIFANNEVLITGISAIHWNGPPATPATDATQSNEQPALWTSKIPNHEPYARVMTKNDYTHEPEYSYADQDVNRIQRGRNLNRGMYWRR